MSALGELATIRKRKGRATRSPAERNDGKAAIFFLGPWFVGLALIIAGPLAASLYLSFTDYDLLSDPVFTGLENYIQMLDDPRLRKSLAVTFTYVFVSVPLQLAAALGLALLLPCLPFALEMLALRRMTPTAFGTLMALEPAIATLLGLLVLGQQPGWHQLVGIALVVAAGAAAQRGGTRTIAPTLDVVA